MDLRTALQWTAFDLRQAAWDLLVNRLAGSSLVPRVMRYFIYRAAGLRIASPALGPGLYFQSSRVRIGRRTFVNRGTRFFNGNAIVTIGDRVQIAMGVMFITDTHPIGGPEQRCSSEVTSRPIVVGNGCWVGANATVLPGIVLGEGCVVAAGSVVVEDCRPNGLYAGVPARRVRELPGSTTDP